MMKLSYRGISYTQSPLAVEQMESDLSGSYRGHQFKFGYPRHIPASHPVVALSYRGVPYQTTATGDVQPVRPSQPQPLRDLAALREREPQMQQRAVMQDLAAVHHRNLYEMLERRIQSARAKGDQSLVEQLEQERRQMV
ncbi:MAG: DUF4278 domain-containing protein [Elainellaceae cyanobacterium]